MTNPQFEALAQLLRLRQGPARDVVRLVLVYAATVPEAAREVGMEYQAAYQAVRRAKTGLELARTALGERPEGLQ